MEQLPDGAAGRGRAEIDVDALLAEGGGQGVEHGRLGEARASDRFSGCPASGSKTCCGVRWTAAASTAAIITPVAVCATHTSGLSWRVAAIQSGGNHVEDRNDHHHRGQFVPRLDAQTESSPAAPTSVAAAVPKK